MINFLLKNRRPGNLLLIFELLSIFLLFFYNNKHIDRYIAILFVGLVLIIYISNLVLSRVSTGDNYIFLIVSMLMTIGIVTIYRISPTLGLRQLVWALIGILTFYLTYFVIRVMRRLENLTTLYLGFSILFFLLTLIFGKELHGSKNWIVFGNDAFSIQLSEITKILVMFLIASFYTKFQDKLERNGFKHSSYYLMIVMYVFIGFLFLQKDLGTAVVFMGIYTCLQFVYDKDRTSLIVNICLMIFGAIVSYFLFSHVRTRVTIWLSPLGAIKGRAGQVTEALFAIGEGGFFGSGIGLGYPSLVGVNESDFIFSVICEEMGVFMGIGIIMLFMLLIYRAVKIALNQEFIFYRILALAVAILFAIHAFLNIGGVIKLIPMTGLTFPFVSYGGSAMISSFVALGILQFTGEDISYLYSRSSNNESK